jgi:hypothetical protein
MKADSTGLRRKVQDSGGQSNETLSVLQFREQAPQARHHQVGHVISNRTKDKRFLQPTLQELFRPSVSARTNAFEPSGSEALVPACVSSGAERFILQRLGGAQRISCFGQDGLCRLDAFNVTSLE